MDITAAYLNADLSEEAELYITPSPTKSSKLSKDQRVVYRLRKALFGLKMPVYCGLINWNSSCCRWVSKVLRLEKLGILNPIFLKEIVLNQSDYIQKMAKHFNIEALNVDTPLSYEFSFDPHEEGNDLEDEGDLSKRIKEYRERVGALQYLANSSKPDLSFASNYLSRFCLYPHRDLKRQLDRCIDYALKTRNYSIKYS
ncbi:unnamed protein product [Ambrosiozyma monospora]|uniref:Unnamed protein product n=1 Tax=Ambrosiozyma monospora TaxID=43982 RepID=A0A9W6TAH4_AMBMO|nr:unnamed protein product [Ambrosiozyma monospora]